MAIGTWLQGDPAFAGLTLAGGHDLGNHTWSHPVFSDLPEADVRDEISRCRDLLIQLTGRPAPSFRTSSALPGILDDLSARGLTAVTASALPAT